MTTTYNYYYNFSVIRENNTSENPLLIYLHARWYNFLTNEKGTDYPNELILSLDDHLPNEIVNTFWYGYHNNFNFYNPDTIPKEGTVTDYTIRRIKWTINWVKNNFPVDTNRLYFCGGSMGGSGSILAGLSMYDKIAAIYTINPKFDYSFLYDPNPESLYNTGKLRRTLISRLWGSTDINLPTSEDIPVYSKLNAGFMLKSIKKKSIPFIIAFNGKNDNIVGWAEKIPYYKAVESSKHGGYYFWDQRTHNLNSLKNLGSLQNPEIIHKFALNKSYPAFSKCTINNEPGNGISTNGDPVGTINGYLSWKDSIIDEENVPTHDKKSMRHCKNVVAQFAYNLVNMINNQSKDFEYIELFAGNNEKRIKRGKAPQRDVTFLRLSGELKIYAKYYSENRGKINVRYLVRGHWREFKSERYKESKGKKKWIYPFYKGDPTMELINKKVIIKK